MVKIVEHYNGGLIRQRKASTFYWRPLELHQVLLAVGWLDLSDYSLEKTVTQ